MSGARALVIIGGGEHARVVLDAARTSGEWRPIGYVDERQVVPSPEEIELPYLGNDDLVLGALPDACFVIGIGSAGPRVRRAIAARYENAGVTWALVVHPRAMISTLALLQPGTVVLAGAVVNTGARIGPHCIVNTGAVIEHDVVLGPFVHVASAAAIGGGAQIGEDAFLGLGCRVRDHVEVGPRATIGMGAVVVGSVAADTTFMGVPARAREYP